LTRNKAKKALEAIERERWSGLPVRTRSELRRSGGASQGRGAARFAYNWELQRCLEAFE